MNELVLQVVTVSLVLIDIIVAIIYTTSIELIYEKNRAWVFCFLFWLGIVLLQAVLYSWLPGRIGAEMTYMGEAIVLEDGALIRNCGYIILIHELGIGYALLKYIWNVIRKKERFNGKFFMLEFFIGALLCAVAILLMQSDFKMDYEGGETFASVLTAILFIVGIGFLLTGIILFYKEEKKKKAVKKSEQASSRPAGGQMEKRLCYCRSCATFFIIRPNRPCPKCRGKMTSSLITEEVWNRSSSAQKTVYKNNLKAESNTAKNW